MSRSDTGVGASPKRGAPATVLVVDDSAFMRQLISEVIAACPDFRVIGTARDGLHAMTQVRELNPDLVTLDIDMPGRDGLAALQQIMREAPRPVVMLSAGGPAGADAALLALELGAVEFVRKPSGQISLDLDDVRVQLLDALRAAVSMNRSLLAARAAFGGRLPGASQATHARRLEAANPRAALHVVCVAASTGGPAALSAVIPSLPWLPHTAVLVAQHLPPGFTDSLAKRLDASSAMSVREATPNEPLLEGVVYVAPGGRHLRVRQDHDGLVRCQVDDAASGRGARPSADLLFASVAEVFGARSVGVVLTGMGSDGAEGLQAIRRVGGRAFVQDTESCIVDGMPTAANRDGGCAVLGLGEMARGIVDALPLTRTSGSAERTRPGAVSLNHVSAVP